jgi:hypothetical protein
MTSYVDGKGENMNLKNVLSVMKYNVKHVFVVSDKTDKVLYKISHKSLINQDYSEVSETHLKKRVKHIEPLDADTLQISI